MRMRRGVIIITLNQSHAVAVFRLAPQNLIKPYWGECACEFHEMANASCRSASRQSQRQWKHLHTRIYYDIWIHLRSKTSWTNTHSLMYCDDRRGPSNFWIRILMMHVEHVYHGHGMNCPCQQHTQEAIIACGQIWINISTSVFIGLERCVGETCAIQIHIYLAGFLPATKWVCRTPQRQHNCLALTLSTHHLS